MHELLEAKGYKAPDIPKIIGLFDRLGKPSYDEFLETNFDKSDQESLNDFIKNVPSGAIIETNERLEGGRHRPPRLYRAVLNEQEPYQRGPES